MPSPATRRASKEFLPDKKPGAAATAAASLSPPPATPAPPPSRPPCPWSVFSDAFTFALLIAAVCIALIVLLINSSYGRAFKAIREDEIAAEAMGVNLAKHMRARQNFLSAAFRLNKAEEKRMREESMALLEEQGLAHLKDEVASSLPYGLQRRLEIARALATDPKLLLLDEPAAGMNPQETRELTDFIKQIRTEYDLSVFMIEHHMDLVMQISDRIYVLDFGRLIIQGTPEAVQNDQRVIDAYLGVADDAED